MQDLSRMSDDELRALHAQMNGGPAPRVAPPPDVVVRRANPVQQQRDQTALEIERARLAAQQAENANAGLERDRLAAQTALAQAQAANATNGGPARYMSDNSQAALENQVQLFLNMQRSANTFNPDYGGNSMTGGLENTLHSMYSGFGTPGQQQWWADFSRTDNVIRNSLFGASLTPGEQAAYEATTITPSMDPAQIRENLRQRAEIMRASLARRASVLRAGNINPQQIDAALGDAAPLLAPQQPQRNDSPAAAAIPTGGAGGPPSGPVDPFGQGGPTVLPTARGARADAGIGANGVVDAATGNGMRVVPELYGLGGEISSLIQQGATREQVLGHYQARMDRAGITPSLAQVQVINEVVQKHQQFPNAPVSSLADGWDNFHMQPTNDTGGSMLGRVADSAIGAGLIGAANGVTAGGLRAVQGDQGRSVMDYAQAERPVSTFVGDTLGTAGAMLGVNGAAGIAGRSAGMLGRGGRALTAVNGVGADALYGAVRGAAEADPGNRLTSAALGAGFGAAGNLGGQAVAGVGGAMVRGVTDPSVRYLADRGINMSMGQLLGNRSVAGRFVNKLESVPFVGDMLGARRADSIGDYGRAQLTENLAPIGYRPPTGPLGRPLPYSQDMLAHAQDAVGNAYGKALDGVNIAPDPQFAQEAGAALRRGEGVVDMGQKFRQLMDSQVGELFNTPNGELGGPQLQAALSRTREIGSSLRGTGDPVAPLVGDAADQFGNALNGLIERQAPGVVPQLQAANRAYAGLVPVENASITGVNNGGMFTPAQYGRSAVNNTRRFGGRAAAARGDVPGGELQRHAQDIIPSTIPDSGTVGRGMASMLLPAALGGSAIGLGTFTDHPVASAGLGALALLSTRGGSRALQRSMLGGARRQRLGQALLDNRGSAGLLGASLLIPAYSAAGQ